MIEIKNLKKNFGELQVLKGVDMKVTKGEVLVIMGPSGSGKSTLLRCIAGLEEYHEGIIILEEKNIFDYTRKNLVQKIGFVFQQHNLFPHLKIIDNIALGLIRTKKMQKEEAYEKAIKVLEKVHLKDKVYNFPGQLSGGQQQRAGIARALAMEPEIILFDEPTSSLDPGLVYEVKETMVELANSGTTMIVVTHEVDFAKKAGDRIVFMKDGKILENMDPDTFFKTELKYEIA
ncbi:MULTISPECIES: amino acid ABC transporter ATP-binding protein [unclassified Marinitoga]|uniref:amino acid ABC transporter ATP-binding protein n=1 Tax=unclassified Marinitoga TaxID=2640159 RepID=UPI0006411419|nr:MULTISPECIES: amino acid ABC transporter ATP-binding protein [unclassified Marinitoga]KLO24855.1 amino acid ABC transporter ATP-binding protein [Marinitoga sp. 1155]NUU98780.1 glutamine ABC transporter ATP-binding protein [Marinitoga sp. 1154]